MPARFKSRDRPTRRNSNAIRGRRPMPAAVHTRRNRGSLHRIICTLSRVPRRAHDNFSARTLLIIMICSDRMVEHFRFIGSLSLKGELCCSLRASRKSSTDQYLINFQDRIKTSSCRICTTLATRSGRSAASWERRRPICMVASMHIGDGDPTLHRANPPSLAVASSRQRRREGSAQYQINGETGSSV
jgi:hypothetical protein